MWKTIWGEKNSAYLKRFVWSKQSVFHQTVISINAAIWISDGLCGMKPKAEGYQAVEKHKLKYAWMASIAVLHLRVSTENQRGQLFLQAFKEWHAIFWKAVWWRRNKALPCSGSGMGCYPSHLCWPTLASVSPVLGHSGGVRWTVCLRKRTDKTKLSLWLQREE